MKLTSRFGLFALVLGAAAASNAVVYSLSTFNQTLTGGATTVSTVNPNMYTADMTKVIKPGTLGAGGFAEMRMRVDINAAAANASSINNIMTFGFGHKVIAENTNTAAARLGALGNSSNGSNNWGAPIMYYRDTDFGTRTAFNKQYRTTGISSSPFDTGKFTAFPKDDASNTAAAIGSKLDIKVRVNTSGAFTLSVRHLDVNGNVLPTSALFGSSPLANPQIMSSTINFSGTGLLSNMSEFVPIIRYDTGYNTAAGWEVRFSNVELEVVPEPATLAALGLGAALILRRRKK
ncbi:MAG: PEP-CTERM sorting domain-containing protein [Chthonomonas sp.]|nr:PEP-CTERM sorting domain-containing protein [Chthonomonas sp.]